MTIPWSFFFVLVGFWIAPSDGLARSFDIQFGAESQPQWQQTFRSKARAVYQSVTDFAPDPQPSAPLHIVFGPLEGHLGFHRRIDEIRNVIYIDSSLQNTVMAQVVLAHELVHVLRGSYQSNEDIWLEEGLAKLMEVLYAGTVIALDAQTRFLSQPKLHLSSEKLDYLAQGNGYWSAFYFAKYLYDNMGGRVLYRELMTSPFTGWRNIQESLKNISAHSPSVLRVPTAFQTPRSLYLHFSLAVALNNSQLGYGLSRIDPRLNTGLAEMPAAPLARSSTFNFIGDLPPASTRYFFLSVAARAQFQKQCQMPQDTFTWTIDRPQEALFAVGMSTASHAFRKLTQVFRLSDFCDHLQSSAMFVRLRAPDIH